MQKPPLGAGPSWYVLPKRIKELSDAIGRYTECERMTKDKKVTGLIKEWATEIIRHCETIDRIQELREESNG